MHTYYLTALVTLGIAGLMFGTAINVGRQRVRYKIGAPHTTGHPMLERAFRVQMNTLENVVLVLPLLWLFAVYASNCWAAGLGALWLAARVWYAVAYMKDPETRGPAFGTSMAVVSVLLLGSLVAVVKGMIGA